MSERLCKNLLGEDVYKHLTENTTDETELNNIIYELYYELLANPTHNKQTIQKNIQKIIQDKSYGFGHHLFDGTRRNQEEQDGFIENPFDVADGIFTCGKCGGTRTYSYSKQVRSCDEGMSVFVTCVKCKHKWMHSG